MPRHPQVKTQRACSDYHKVEFPHCRTRITDLRYIGSVTAARLKVGPGFVRPDGRSAVGCV